MMRKIIFLTIITLSTASATVIYFNENSKSTAFQKKGIYLVQKSDTNLKEKIQTQTRDTFIKNEISSDLFEFAANEMIKMLNGTQKLDFKRAVFLTENAYYDGKLDWTEFCDNIEFAKRKITQMIITKNLQKYKTAGNWAIFTYMTDNISENNYEPYKYDLENFMGDNGYESFMVSKLLKSKKGNCHSLPFLYKILANEVNVEAFIATAPMHIFIKHKDEEGKWWNLELTSGTFSRTSFIIESFNVSDAGMESGLYMKPLSDKESVALCLNDLLVYYEKKTGNYSGNFVSYVYNEGIKFYPNSLLQLSKADDQKYQLDEAMKKYGLNNYKDIVAYPKLVELEKELQITKALINKIGYSSLTPEQYREKVIQIKNEKITTKN